MKTLKQILQRILRERQGAVGPSSASSNFSRATAAKKDIKNGKPNSQQMNAADIASKMDFDVEPHQDVRDTNPLSFMDVVYNVWGIGSKDEDDEDVGAE